MTPHRRHFLTALVSTFSLAKFSPSMAMQAVDATFDEMLLRQVILSIYPPGSGLNYARLQVNTISQQFSADPKFHDWDLTRYCDQIPVAGTRVPVSTPRTFSERYGILVNSVLIPSSDPALNAKVDTLRKRWEQASASHTAATTQVLREWARFDKAQQAAPEHRRISFEQWLSSGGDNSRIAAEQAMNVAAGNYVSASNEAGQAFGMLATAVTQFGNQGNRINAEAPLSGGTSSTRRMIANWAPTVGTIKDFDTAAKAMSGEARSWKYAKSSGWSSSQSSGGSGSVGYFGITLSGGGSSSSFSSGEDQFSFSLSFRHFARMPVRPGAWFSDALFAEFADGPFNPTWVSRHGGPAKFRAWLWTEYLPRLTSELVLVYKPVIVIGMSVDRYSRTVSSLGGSAGISVGPFSFGASGGGTKEDIQWNKESRTLTLQGPESTQVLAVTHVPLPQLA